MKRVFVAAIVLLAFASVVVLSACGEKEVPAGAIAMVGEESILQEQFDAIITQAKAAYKAQKAEFPATDSAEYDTLKANVVDYLVQAELIEQKAAEMDVKLESSEIDDRIKSIVEQVGGQKKYEQLLKEQGVTEEDLRSQLQVQMLQDKVRTKVGESAKVTDEEIKAYFENPDNQAQFAGSVTARHVLVKTKAQADKVQKLLEADSSDTSWKKVAAEYSTDPGSKDSGGSLGTFQKGRMVQEFETAAFALKTGEISSPVKSEFGYHVIETTEKTPPSKYDDVKAGIEQQLKYQREAEVWQKWLDEAIAAAEIIYAPGFNPKELTATPSPAATPPASPAASVTPSPESSN